MSKLLKLKFLLGVLVVTAVVASASPTLAAITSTLRLGQRSTQVMELQNDLGVTPATGYFGKITLAAVKAFQSAHGLVVDGIFGAKGRAALGGSVVTTYPSGCTATSAYSSTTGAPCTGSVVTTYPSGCTSSVGYSATTGQACNGTVVSNPSGPLAVSLASDNPAAGTIIQGQATADLAHFMFSGTGTLSAITLQRNGISDQNTLANVYLYNGVTRLTDGYSFNNAGALSMGSLNIPINGSMDISVRADVASGVTAYNISVGLTSYTVSGGTATAVSITGNTMQVASSGNLGALWLSANTATGGSINPGTMAATVWSAPIQVNTHNLLLKSANFRVIGSAPSDALANAKLYEDGIQVGSAGNMVTINGTPYIAFDFSAAPITLTTGGHTIDLRADVVKGSSRTITISLQQASDLMLYDTQVGVNIATLGASGVAFSANSATQITVASGSISAVIDPTWNSGVSTVTGGASQVTLAKYKLHAYGEDVKVMDVVITPTLVTATTLSNITLYFNGSQIGSQYTCTTATADPGCGYAHTFSLGSSMLVPAGVDSYLEVKADITTSAGAAITSGTISVAGSIPAADTQGMSSLNTVALVSLPATNALQAQTGSVAISKNTAMGATTISPNTAGAKIGSFVIQNQSTSEGVRVTNLDVGVALGSEVGSTNYSNLRTSETSGNGSQPINLAVAALSTTSWNNFSVDFTIAPGATKTIDIFVDTGATASTSLAVDLYITALGSSSNVTVCSPTKAGGTVNGCNHYATSPETNPAAGQAITIVTPTFNNGGVVISSSTAPQYVATGTTGAEASVAAFNFKSTNGTTTINKLKFRVSGTSAHTTVTSVRVGSVSAPVVSGVAYLQNLGITVPQGGSGVNVNAYMTYAPTGTGQAGTSGDKSFVEITYIDYTAGTTTTQLVGGGIVDPVTDGNTDMGATVGGSTAAALDGSTTGTFTMATNAAAAKFQPGMLVAVDAGPATAILEVQSVSSATVTYQTVYGAGATINGKHIYFYSIPQTAAYGSSVNNCTASMMVDSGLTIAAGGTSFLDCFAIVGSKPTLAVIDASTQLVSGGQVKVGSVSVSADPKGDIAVNVLPLTFNSSGNVTLTNQTVIVKNAADNSTINTCTTGGGSDASDGCNTARLTVNAGSSHNATVTFTGGYTITAGQTVTFDIYVTTGGSLTTGYDSLSVQLNSTPSNFTWTDVAGSGASPGQNGTLLYNYPTNSSVIND